MAQRLPEPNRSKAKRQKQKKQRKQQQLLKQFSTLSEGTLHSPSVSLCLSLVAKLFHRHILLRDGCHQSRRDFAWERRFDVDCFVAARYDVSMALPLLRGFGPLVFAQSRRRSALRCPSLPTIESFLMGIFSSLHLNVESSIVSLIYVERLMEKRRLSLTPRNWRVIVIASILTASKVWDDLSSWNIEFSNLLPVLSLAATNKLEGLFLEALSYDLYISSSEYAKYYFALRGLKNVDSAQIPRYYLDTKVLSSKMSKSKSQSSPSGSPSQTLKLNESFSMSRKTRQFETKSIMEHAHRAVIGVDVDEEKAEPSMMGMSMGPHSPDRAGDGDGDGDHSLLSVVRNDRGALTSSSDSNQSANGGGMGVVREEEAMGVQRSQGVLLRPKQPPSNGQTIRRHAFSMPSKIQTLRPTVNG